MNAPSIEAITRYWLGDTMDDPEVTDAVRERWYRGGAAIDRFITREFGEQVTAALAGRLSAWEATPVGSLALVILLDQFTRNIYRNTARAYSGDALAADIAKRAIVAGHDEALSYTGRVFLYHPFHHSESLDEQHRGVALVEALERAAPSAWRPYLRRTVEGFSRHRDVVARFGRFPHRNRVLGRTSTAEEAAYLEAGADSYGQG